MATRKALWTNAAISMILTAALLTSCGGVGETTTQGASTTEAVPPEKTSAPAKTTEKKGEASSAVTTPKSPDPSTPKTSAPITSAPEQSREERTAHALTVGKVHIAEFTGYFDGGPLWNGEVIDRPLTDSEIRSLLIGYSYSYDRTFDGSESYLNLVTGYGEDFFKDHLLLCVLTTSSSVAKPTFERADLEIISNGGVYSSYEFIVRLGQTVDEKDHDGLYQVIVEVEKPDWAALGITPSEEDLDYSQAICGAETGGGKFLPAPAKAAHTSVLSSGDPSFVPCYRSITTPEELSDFIGKMGTSDADRQKLTDAYKDYNALFFAKNQLLIVDVVATEGSEFYCNLQPTTQGYRVGFKTLLGTRADAKWIHTQLCYELPSNSDGTPATIASLEFGCAFFEELETSDRALGILTPGDARYQSWLKSHKGS